MTEDGNVTEKRMLIDLHAHSSGISKCCRIDAEAVVKAAKEVGLDGIVLTNHYQSSYLKGEAPEEFAERYFEEFHHARRLGERVGCRVLFGIEVTAERYKGVHLLIYGVGEDFLREHPTVYELSLEALYGEVHNAGGVLIQAHPMRIVDRLLDTQYLDGVEISCHPLYEGTHIEELRAVAERDGLLLTCGGDYHADTHRPRCGMYLPTEITDGVALGTYLRDTETVRLAVQEVDAHEPYDVVYTRRERRA